MPGCADAADVEDASADIAASSVVIFSGLYVKLSAGNYIIVCAVFIIFGRSL